MDRLHTKRDPLPTKDQLLTENLPMGRLLTESLPRDPLPTKDHPLTENLQMEHLLTKDHLRTKNL